MLKILYYIEKHCEFLKTNLVEDSNQDTYVTTFRFQLFIN